MTILIGEMLQFGLVLGTIMMGFTVSFFALFSEDRSYGEVGDARTFYLVDVFGGIRGGYVNASGASCGRRKSPSERERASSVSLVKYQELRVNP